jgi:Sigma-70 factor, region 1.
MSIAELQELEEVKQLMTKGQQAGVLTHAEVATALAEVELDEGDIEDLHAHLEKSEIELVEEIDPALAAPRSSARPTSAGAARRRRSTSSRT